MIQGKKTEEAYRATILDSSSSLKEFSLDRKKYFKRYILGEKVKDEDSKASVVGRLVECLLWEKDRFDDKFHTTSVANPPNANTNMGKFVLALCKYTEEAMDEKGNTTQTFEEIAKKAHIDSEYKWELSKVLEKFQGTDNEIYFREMKEVRAKGLTVVSADDITNAERVVDELRSNEVTAPILNLQNDDRYTVHIQLQVAQYTVDGLLMKSMMDLVVVDHKEKTIQVYDLKVVWAVEGFFREYYLYRRAYIQAYVYKEAAKWWKSQSEELEYYTVLDPKFIVADSINYFNPLVYVLSSDDIEDAYNGFDYKGTFYPGVKEVVEGVKWAKENNKWNISYKNYKNNGIVNIRG